MRHTRRARFYNSRRRLWKTSKPAIRAAARAVYATASEDPAVMKVLMDTLDRVTHGHGKTALRALRNARRFQQLYDRSRRR